jgi:hypothetical protein
MYTYREVGGIEAVTNFWVTLSHLCMLHADLLFTFTSWRWSQHVPSKRLLIFTEQHDVISQEDKTLHKISPLLCDQANDKANIKPPPSQLRKKQKYIIISCLVRTTAHLGRGGGRWVCCVGEIMIIRGKPKKVEGEPPPASYFPPLISHEVCRDWSRGYLAQSQFQTTWAMTRS